MYRILLALIRRIGSPKDQKSESMSLAVLFTLFLSFMVTMTWMLAVLQPGSPFDSGTILPATCPAGYVGESAPELPESNQVP
jgi:hypothetical protein